MIETNYRCKCGATDRDRSPEGSGPPLALNCWKCKAGKGKDISEMIAMGIGMLPVKEN